MADQPEEKPDLLDRILERLGIVSGRQLQNVKLGPGVVGRNSSIAWALELVMLVGVVAGIYLHSQIIVIISMILAFVGGLAIVFGNIHFGKKNPAAALLEGSEFLQYHQMQQAIATKGGQAIELPFATPTQSPVALPGTEKEQLPGQIEPKE